MQHREAVGVGEGAHAVELSVASFDPTGGAEGAVILLAELVARFHVVVEEAAVIDDARDDVDVELRRGGQAQAAGPGFERVENNHRPVDELGEFLEATDEVEGEAVRGSGRDAEALRKATFFHAIEGVPHGGAGVAERVGIVEEEQVELLHAAAFEGVLGRHFQVLEILLRAAQRGVGEAREAFRAVAFAIVKIVAHRADERIGVARKTCEGAAEHRVGDAVAVNVGGHEGADAALVGVADDGEKTVVGQGFAKVHEAAAAPDSVRCSGGFHKFNFECRARRNYAGYSRGKNAAGQTWEKLQSGAGGNASLMSVAGVGRALAVEATPCETPREAGARRYSSVMRCGVSSQRSSTLRKRPVILAGLASAQISG